MVALSVKVETPLIVTFTREFLFIVSIAFTRVLTYKLRYSGNLPLCAAYFFCARKNYATKEIQLNRINT